MQRFPRIAGIYQSASAMHGKRNLGFAWMAESLRRNNFLMRKLFIDELGRRSCMYVCMSFSGLNVIIILSAS
jgi:hypothetical protein